MNENLYAPLRQWPAEDITPAKRPYIPAGCDQQGRVTPTLEQRPGLHLVSTGDCGAAHTHAGITSDSDSDDDDRAPMTCGDRIALACVMLVSFLAVLGGVSVAWTRWLP